MKKILAGLTGVLMLLALSLPARAEVYVYGEINKVKNVDVDEDVNIDKDIDIDAKVDVDLDSAAEAGTVVNAEMGENTVEKTGTNLGPETLAEIDGDAFGGADGIIQVNQAPGNMNNQGNATAIAVSLDGDKATLTHSQASESDDNAGNSVNAYDTEITNIINFAFRNLTGVVSVNQAGGNMNNQHNSVAIAAGDGIVALSEADLGQFNTDNYVNEVNTYKTDMITGSAFENFSGVLSVNQASGNMNNQSNVVSVSVLTYPVSWR
jgi:hypothetical protein